MYGALDCKSFYYIFTDLVWSIVFLVLSLCTSCVCIYTCSIWHIICKHWYDTSCVVVGWAASEGPGSSVVAGADRCPGKALWQLLRAFGWLHSAETRGPAQQPCAPTQCVHCNRLAHFRLHYKHDLWRLLAGGVTIAHSRATKTLLHIHTLKRCVHILRAATEHARTHPHLYKFLRFWTCKRQNLIKKYISKTLFLIEDPKTQTWDNTRDWFTYSELCCVKWQVWGLLGWTRCTHSSLTEGVLQPEPLYAQVNMEKKRNRQPSLGNANHLEEAQLTSVPASKDSWV